MPKNKSEKMRLVGVGLILLGIVLVSKIYPFLTPQQKQSFSFELVKFSTFTIIAGGIILLYNEYKLALSAKSLELVQIESLRMDLIRAMKYVSIGRRLAKSYSRIDGIKISILAEAEFYEAMRDVNNGQLEIEKIRRTLQSKEYDKLELPSNFASDLKKIDDSLRECLHDFENGLEFVNEAAEISEAKNLSSFLYSEDPTDYATSFDRINSSIIAL